MTIKCIVKLKLAMYDVLFDDGQSIKVHEESLVSYVLITGKELEEEEFNEIVQNIQYDQAYVAAIKYISYKIRSNKEMTDYLSEDYEAEIVRQTIYRLQNEGYLNEDRKSTRLNSSHVSISYAVFCLKKKSHKKRDTFMKRRRRSSKRNSTKR